MQKVVKFLILAYTVVTLCSCDKDEEHLTRSFHMGFTPFPYDVSQEAVNFTYSKLASDADIINHHFDNGVPWTEALKDEPFPISITDDWTFRKNITAGKKLYISVTPVNSHRNGLALYRAEKEDMPLPEPWKTYSFNASEVKTAYLNYCTRIIDFFKPDYFNMAIEANLVYANNPSAWTAFLELHQYIYAELKARYPTLVVFSSVTGAHILRGFIDNNDYVQQRLAVLQVLESSDLYALSFYPYLSSFLGNSYPENTFSELFSISSKPLAIAETGYAAQNFTIHTGAIEVEIAGDPNKQNKYLEDLLNACTKRNTVFVINFVLRDYDAVWQALGAKNDITIAWRDTGLYDENGNQRVAYTTWKNFLNRHYTNP